MYNTYTYIYIYKCFCSSKQFIITPTIPIELVILKTLFGMMNQAKSIIHSWGSFYTDPSPRSDNPFQSLSNFTSFFLDYKSSLVSGCFRDTGWWFGTSILFSHHIGNFIIPTDELHHFSEGLKLNHQPEYILNPYQSRYTIVTSVISPNKNTS